MSLHSKSQNLPRDVLLKLPQPSPALPKETMMKLARMVYAFHCFSFAVHWKDSSEDAICRIYDSSQKPGFWRSFWDAVWPTFRWSEALVDGLLTPTYEVDIGYAHFSDNKVHVDMLMESNQKLYVSWEWLCEQLLDSFATVLSEALWAAMTARSAWGAWNRAEYASVQACKTWKISRSHTSYRRQFRSSWL